MVLREIHDILESWAPKAIAWERDNVGLQSGSMDQTIRRILVTVDVTDAVLDEARRKRANLVLSHHPLLFNPLTSIRPDQRTGRLLLKAIHNNIALYAIHTNLDFIEWGVSSALAEKLSLTETRILDNDQHRQVKIIVFVPIDYTNKVMLAMSRAGAGVIGNYETCSFRTTGTGTFLPLQGARPHLGKKGQLEQTQESRLEMILPEWKTDAVLQAMRSVHPYDEIAYDVYRLANASMNVGAGAIGVLRKTMPLKKFLSHVQKSLRLPVLRYTGNPSMNITRVAVCGGSGSKYVAKAITEEADAFVTADVQYHAFQEADGHIALIDAGHYETERPAVQRVVQFLHSHNTLKKQNIQIFPSTINSNFVQYS